MGDGQCPWCRGRLEATGRPRRFCSKRCRQAAWRLRRRRTTAHANAQPKRLAYADPPYPGLAHYYRGEANYGGEVDHVALVSLLQRYDGWALSTSSRSLRDVLPLCPPNARVASWVKPIGVPKATAGMHSTWEPVIVVPARASPPGVRDWLRAMPARGEGSLIGRKPVAFVHWLFELLGAVPELDALDDLYPGTGIVGRCWDLMRAEAPLRAAVGDVSPPAPEDVSPRAAGTASLEYSGDG